MKRTLVVVAALLLTVGVAWAEEPAADAPTPAAAPADATFEGGGCVLPDLAGLSDEEIEQAALEAGLGIQPPAQAAAPACPVKFSCNSITNCGAGSLCSLSDIGPCCTTSSGLSLCCITGTIKVRRCPCVCTGNPCALSCVNSTDVKWRCA